MNADELKAKIAEVKKQASNKYNAWSFGRIKEYLSYDELKDEKLEIAFKEWEERYSGSDGYYPPGCRADVRYDGEDVLSISDCGWVNYYIPGEWENLIPVFLKKADEEFDARNKRKKERDEANELERLRNEAKNFGIIV